MTEQKVSRKRATIINLIHQYITIALALVNGIVLVPLYLKYLDFKLYGAWLSTGNVLMWLSLFDSGFSDVLKQQVAKCFGSGDYEEMGKVMGGGFFCIFLLGILPFLVSIGVSFGLPYLFELEPEQDSSLMLSFIVAGLNVSLVVISGGGSAVLQGFQQNLYFSGVYVFGAVAGIATTVIMLIKGFGLVSLPAGLCLRCVIWLLFWWSYVLWYSLRRLRIKIQFHLESVRQITRLTGWTFINRIGYQLFGNCDALAIGVILGAEVTPVYVLTRRSWDLLKLFLERIGTAFLPSLSHLSGEGKRDRFGQIGLKLFHYVMYALFLGMPLYIGFNRSFVSLWVGEDLYAGTAFDILIMVSLVFWIFTSMAHHVLFADGKIKEVALIGFFLYPARAGVMVLLILLMGITGSPVSMVLCFSIAALFFYGPYWLKIIDRRLSEIGPTLARFGFYCLLSIVAGILIQQYAVMGSWLLFAFYGVCTAAVTGLVLLIAEKNLRRDFFHIIEGMKAKFRGRIHSGLSNG